MCWFLAKYAGQDIDRMMSKPLSEVREGVEFINGFVERENSEDDDE